jgi:hypothetical protein
VDLSLNDDDIRAKFAGGGFGLFGRFRNDPLRNRYTVFFQKGFALIFVYFHKAFNNNVLRLAHTQSPHQTGRSFIDFG